MALQVYDYRSDIRNVVVTPEIRARFMRMEPGTATGIKWSAGVQGHSHDLGHEVFLVLEGQAEFNIDGEFGIVGPGQMCFARVDERHEVRVVGDKPVIMYLSVTPHLEPTHTQWDDEGSKRAPRYGITASAGGALEPTTSTVGELVDKHVAASEALARATATNARAQAESALALKGALAGGDKAAAKEAVDAMWSQMYLALKELQAMEHVWNELAVRATE
jgi:mannose-6-phosphate isomerase-like protein (cupin superfamily)